MSIYAQPYKAHLWVYQNFDFALPEHLGDIFVIGSTLRHGRGWQIKSI